MEGLRDPSEKGWEEHPREVGSPLATLDRVGIHDARWPARDLGREGVLHAPFVGRVEEGTTMLRGGRAIYVLLLKNVHYLQ